MANLLLVDPLDHDVLLVGYGHGHSVGNGNLEFVCQSHAELEHVALDSGKVADTLNFQSLFITLCDADDHVGHQRAAQPVQCAAGALIVAPGNDNCLGLLVVSHGDLGTMLPLELSLGAFDGDHEVGQLDLHPSGYLHRLISNPRHVALPLHLLSTIH